MTEWGRRKEQCLLSWSNELKIYKVHKVTDEEGTATEKETIMEKVKGFYQKLYKKRNLCNNYGEFLDNVPKISEWMNEWMMNDMFISF